MRKIVLNVSDSFFEKLKFEAIHEGKDIPSIIAERLQTKPFAEEVEEAYNDFVEAEIKKLMKGE